VTITGLGNWICVMLSVAFSSALSADDSQAVADPSLVPLVGSDGNPAARYRAYGDINKDGFEDLIVSENVEAMSQNGLNLLIYWGDSAGTYSFYDTVYTSPKRLKFEIDGRGIRLWHCWHMSASEGILGYDWLADSGIVQGDNITVYGGDGGGSISRAVVDAYFNTSDVRLRIEQYRIVNGVVEIVKP
jgi:hypothetical protein